MRERDRAWAGKGQRERHIHTESETGSRLWAVSTEPDVGLEPMNPETMTWAKVECLTDWATQAPLHPALCLRFTHVDARGYNLPHSPPYNIPLRGCTVICSAIEGHRSCCHFCTIRDGPANDVQDQRHPPPQGMSQEHTALPHVVHIFGFSLQSQILLKQLVPLHSDFPLLGRNTESHLRECYSGK